MGSETGFRRLVGFTDAVVAIAITLLVLPLVDAAGSIGHQPLDQFLRDNHAKLWAFGLSFVVIARYWWAQHHLFERLGSYNLALVWATFVWLSAIVFLPFPTELLGTAQNGSTTVHAIYLGTMLLAGLASVVQVGAAIRWPALQNEDDPNGLTMDSAVVAAVLMTVALVLAVADPSIGLWSLLVLVLSNPLERGLAALRARHLRNRSTPEAV
jgi:uncharacterized membrane protein